MNITILCNSAAWGGLEMLTCKIAQWLLESKHNITVLCSSNNRILKFCIENNITTIIFETKFKYGDFKGLHFLKNWIATQDILLLPQSKDIKLAVLAKKLATKTCKCKLIHLQNMNIGVDKNDIIHTYFYNNLDAWISPLNLLKEETLQRSKINPEKIHIIPFGIETKKFIISKYTQIEARKILQLPEDQIIVGIIGRIDPEKGQEFLIKAIHQLKQNGKIIHAVIIGEETSGDKRQYLQYLKNLSKDLDIIDLIHFCPFQKDVPLAYAALDIFVMASTHETYGLVTLEAMSAGLPVVAAFAGGTKELIKDRETGLFFESKNANDLANKLTELFHNQDFRQQISKQAQQETIKTFDYRSQIIAMEKLFTSLTI